MRIDEISFEDYQMTPTEREYSRKLFRKYRHKFKLLYTVDDIGYYQFENGGYRILVAVRKDKVIGHCLYRADIHFKHDIYYITEIWINQYYRKKGYGYVFYLILLYKLKLVLEANFLYRGSQRAWGRMIQDPRILVVGVRLNHTYQPNSKIKSFFPIEIYQNRMTAKKNNNIAGDRLVRYIAVAASNVPDWLNKDLISLEK